ncbi:MAG: DUF2510 domain-containing protein [Actinomycetota bacterium]
MSETPQAGWYDDPDDPRLIRYWDGERWTFHRSQRTASATRPEVAGTFVSTSWRALRVLAATWRVLLVGTVAIVMAALVVLASLDELVVEIPDGRGFVIRELVAATALVVFGPPYAIVAHRVMVGASSPTMSQLLALQRPRLFRAIGQALVAALAFVVVAVGLSPIAGMVIMAGGPETNTGTPTIGVMLAIALPFFVVGAAGAVIAPAGVVPIGFLGQNLSGRWWAITSPVIPIAAAVAGTILFGAALADVPGGALIAIALRVLVGAWAITVGVAQWHRLGGAVDPALVDAHQAAPAES